jgi:hypothetical protein
VPCDSKKKIDRESEFQLQDVSKAFETIASGFVIVEDSKGKDNVRKQVCEKIDENKVDGHLDSKIYKITKNN